MKWIVVVLGLTAGSIMTASAQNPEVSPPDTAPMQLPQGVQQRFEQFQTVMQQDFRAFAFDPTTGRYGWSWLQRSPKQAIDDAVNGCKRTGDNCTLYFLGDTFVWGMSSEQLAAEAVKYYAAASPYMAQSSPESFIGKRLSSEEIALVLSDVSFEGINFNGMKYKGILLSNGTMSADATFLNTIEIAPEDSGTWKVLDNKLCRQWQHWLGGRRECLVVTKDGQTIHAYDAHGDQIEILTLLDNL